MDVNKKKTRQRNRPRNKANRNLQQETNTDLIPNKETNESEVNECSLTSNVNENTLQSPLTAALQKLTPQNEQVATSVTPLQFENNDAIKIIQQMLREKLLKKNNTELVTANTSNEKNSSKCSSKSSSKSSSTTSLPKTTNTVESVKENVRKSKSKEKLVENNTANSANKDAFIANLQKKMESMMSTNYDGADIPNTLFGNLQKLLNQDPISDIESSDDEDEYVEYIYKPRQYFVVPLCNFCKCDLGTKGLLPCNRCKLTYYCSAEHMKCDENHKQLCYALKQVNEYSSGGHIFYKCGDFTSEQFRSYRIVNIRKVESTMNRPLTATEQEVILFPRICADVKCREYRHNKLTDCENCGQVAFCKDKPEHLSQQHHQKWCRPYQLFKELVMFQEKFGRLDPSLPSKVLRDIPGASNSTRQILSKLAFDMHNQCEYAALSQISTCPLTAWYALKICDQLKKGEVLTIHLIGAEIEFEVDVLHKWELFFMHITPCIKQLNVVFVGPELNPRNICFEQLKKTKCCRICRKNERTVNYYFENKLYHDYSKTEQFLKPDLICFFNAGLYRATGYQLEDTWPETILAAANCKCPVVVTAYTQYEAPLDMTRFVQEANRRLNVVLPPLVNPFASDKPERNFISDEEAPLMFKNYYCFVVE